MKYHLKMITQFCNNSTSSNELLSTIVVLSYIAVILPFIILLTEIQFLEIVEEIKDITDNEYKIIMGSFMELRNGKIETKIN